MGRGITGTLIANYRYICFKQEAKQNNVHAMLISHLTLANTILLTFVQDRISDYYYEILQITHKPTIARLEFRIQTQAK